MMFEYTYLLNNFDADFFTEKNSHSAGFIIPINENIAGRQPDLFQTLQHSSNKFCFCITSDAARFSKTFIKKEIVQNFVRLLFLPNYMKTAGRYLFFTEAAAKSQGKLDAVQDELYNEFKKQGIEICMVQMTEIESLPGVAREEHVAIVHAGLNTYLNDDDEAGFTRFTSQFVLPDDFNKKWIVPVINLAGFTNKTNRIKRFESWMQQSDPFKFALIEKYNTAMASIQTMQSENDLLKFKLENSAYYLQLIRKESRDFLGEIGSLRLEITRLTQQIVNAGHPAGHHLSHTLDDPDLIMRLQAQIGAETNRANETLNWYKKEYEVLPMWYKKFGQLIKALMGKRTFKSLFK